MGSRSAVDLAVEASRRIGSVERVEEAVEGLRIASPTRLSGGETRERQRSSLAISSRREPPKYIRRLPRFSKGGWGSDSCLKNNNLKKKETTARPPRRLYKHKKNFEIRNRKSLKETTSRTQGHIPQAEKQQEEEKNCFNSLYI